MITYLSGKFVLLLLLCTIDLGFCAEWSEASPATGADDNDELVDDEPLETDDDEFDREEQELSANGDWDQDAHVATLTNNNFQNFLSGNRFAFIDFYAHWCNHCKDLEPEFEAAATSLRKESLRTRFAKMDAVGESQGGSYIIEGYPTMLFFVDGAQRAHYKNLPPKTKAIEHFVRKQEFHSPHELKTSADENALLAGMRSGLDFALVAHVQKGTARSKAFYQACDLVRDALANFNVTSMRFGVFVSPKTKDTKARTSLVMTRPGFFGSDGTSEFQGSWTGGNILKWVQNGFYADVQPSFNEDFWTMEQTNRMSFQGFVTAIIDEKEAGTQGTGVRANALAQLSALSAAKPKWPSILVDIADMSKEERDHFNPKGDAWPIVSVISWAAQRRYVLSGHNAISAPNAIETFVASVQTNKAKFVQRSQATPVDPVSSDGIVTLTADTFDEYVLNPRKDVFVKYYSKDCSHCVEMEPAWEQLAKHVQKKRWYDRGLALAEITIAENDVQEDTHIVPKLVLYPAVKADRKLRERVEFTGTRSYERMLSFLMGTAQSLDDVQEL